MKNRLTVATVFCTLLATASDQGPTGAAGSAPAAPAPAAAPPAGSTTAPPAPASAPAGLPAPPENDPFAQAEAELIGSIVQQKIAAALHQWRMLGYGRCGEHALAVIGTAAQAQTASVSATADGAPAAPASPPPLIRTVVRVGLSLTIEIGRGQTATLTVIDLEPTGITLRTESGQQIVLR